jgi:hypothetical protein
MLHPDFSLEVADFEQLLRVLRPFYAKMYMHTFPAGCWRFLTTLRLKRSFEK